MHSKILKRIVSLVACVSVALTCVHVMAWAESSSSIKAKIAEYERQSKELDGKIDALESSAAEYESVQSALKDKIDNIQSQIDLYNDSITELQNEIDKNEEQIAEKEKDINSTKDALKQRLKAIYVAGSFNSLSILLGSEDYGDFLARSELMRGVTDHDTKLMDRMQKEVVEINKLKADNEAKMSDVEDLKSDMVEKQQALDAEYEVAQAKLNSISQSQSALEQEKSEVESAIAEKQAELKQIEAEIASAAQSSKRVYSGDGFAWPFQSSYYISCSYMGYSNHTGVDITCAGAYGKPIYAAADGTVVTAVWSDVSYGNRIILDHGTMGGDHYATLYAHCSSLLVSEGQSVKKGDLIAYCGSSGNSTGPHLHFEVRVNGSSTNPMNYSYSTGF